MGSPQDPKKGAPARSWRGMFLLQRDPSPLLPNLWDSLGQNEGNDNIFYVGRHSPSHVVHEGAKAGAFSWGFTSQGDIPQRCRTAKERQAQGSFKNIQPAKTPAGRKLLGSSPNKANLIKFLVEKEKKTPNQGKPRQGAVVTVALCFKITKEQWGKGSWLSQVKKKRHTPPSP
ncbi:hypothetical protein GWK47_044151 [Chionoecetes opilio]|uniref:Uncharacterized protein n=1 Tax=Chionoecetes opilio TaxID=41210 RepID=A0A8J4YE99_CHIOP|nr:hypothetical protein GWK47_044151 [Chionoecetes opilio]